MLILSRKAQEQINIGDDITVTVTRISGSYVTFAIDAPPTTKILRGELAPEMDKRWPKEPGNG